MWIKLLAGLAGVVFGLLVVSVAKAIEMSWIVPVLLLASGAYLLFRNKR